MLRRTHATRVDGCMHGFKDEQGNTILKSLRIQTSDPVAADSWRMHCNHNYRHKNLEGGRNCERSARYTPQLCSAIARHLLGRPANLVSHFLDSAISPRTQLFLADPDPVSVPVICGACEENQEALQEDRLFPAVSN